MTSTDIPDSTAPPDSHVASTEHSTETPSSNPVAPPYDAAPPIASENFHVEQPIEHASSTEAPTEHAPHSTVEEITPALPERPQADATAERVSPEVESLKAMFPDFDVLILQSVLESVGGDQERATDVLLGMSDPNYVSSQHAAPSQSDLDEQLARRLMLEEQQQQASWHPDQQYPHDQNQRRGGNVPYQPRRQYPQAPYTDFDDEEQFGSPSASGGGPSTMGDVSEQLSKFAETGKKTFSSLMTKVKAKMQEFDQSRNPSGAAPQSSWGSGTPSGAGTGANTGMNTQQQGGNQYSQFSTAPSSQSQSQQQGQYFAPSAGGNDYGRTQGYDAAPQTQTQPAPSSGTGLATFTRSPAASIPPAERIPPRPPSAGNVDPTKIGMLPKRPVSLAGTSPTQSRSNTSGANADEDELDYVENPFEEKK